MATQELYAVGLQFVAAAVAGVVAAALVEPGQRLMKRHAGYFIRPHITFLLFMMYILWIASIVFTVGGCVTFAHYLLTGYIYPVPLPAPQPKVNAMIPWLWCPE